ncbi:alpha/beta hydrolase family protein [Bradyrhizobium aeschynomenes]|uniref:alpha/beta hydrolase family protein n=1 Tax=Bradyrhizobium aeschynomenes TaxID=2734909 RepID=UPI001552F058|nr:alpha/beta fold hydrolase [Bradyrhizobium aeschynomenes]NPV24120.1 alpha/beta fold hydrolase [Bradyrhizobium aeschynomenes]
MALLRCVSWLLVLAVLTGPGARAQTFGPVAPAGETARQQQWLVPSTEPGIPAHALLYRPAGDGPFPLALIAHASTQNALRRAQMPQPSYTALARELVARGYAVLVPERLGHGRTGGPYVEDQGGCEEANYEKAGRATAAQILRALAYMREQPFVAKGGALVVGHSAGGWGALALATQSPHLVSGIIVFAPGRGGHADDVEGRVCAEQRLREAVRIFGRDARLDVTWLVAANDSYFPPSLSRQLADAFTSAGGTAEFKLLPPFSHEGHWLAEQQGGITAVSEALARRPPRPMRRH